MVYRKKRYSSRKRSYTKRVSSKMGLSLSTTFLAGAAVGISNLDNKIPKDVTLVAATAPVKGLGVVKGFAQGIILGNVVQHLVGFRTAQPAGLANAFMGF